MDTYLQYFKSLHSLAASTFVLFLFAVTQVFSSLYCTECTSTKYLLVCFLKSVMLSNVTEEKRYGRFTPFCDITETIDLKCSLKGCKLSLLN